LPFRVLTPAAIDPRPESPPATAASPRRVSYRFTMPRNACFRTLVGSMQDAEPLGESQITVTVVSSRGNAIIRTWRLPGSASDGRRSRTECWIDLRQFADQEVEITFSSSTASAGADEWPLAAWGDPAILARRP